MRVQPGPDRRLPRRVRVPVLRPQPPRGEQPGGDVRQRAARGRLHPLLLPSRAQTGRLHAGEGRHHLYGGLDRVGLSDAAEGVPSARRGLRRQREPRRLLLLRLRRSDARAERPRQCLLLLFAVTGATRRLVRLQSRLRTEHPELQPGQVSHSPATGATGRTRTSFRASRARTPLSRARATPATTPRSTAATTSRRDRAPGPARIRTSSSAREVSAGAVRGLRASGRSRRPRCCCLRGP